MKHGRRISRTRTTTRRRIVAGIVTCAAIGALTGTGIASATSGRTGLRADVAGCTYKSEKATARVAVILDKNSIEGHVKRIKQLNDKLRSAYGEVDFYSADIRDSTGVTSATLSKRELNDSTDSGAETISGLELLKKSDVILNYIELLNGPAENQYDGYWDKNPGEAFEMAGEAPSGNPALATFDASDQVKLVAVPSNAGVSNQVRLEPAAGAELRFGNSEVPEQLRDKVAVNLESAKINIGDPECEPAGQSSPTTGTSSSDNGSSSLTVPALIHWQGGDSAEVISVGPEGSEAPVAMGLGLAPKPAHTTATVGYDDIEGMLENCSPTSTSFGGKPQKSAGALLGHDQSDWCDMATSAAGVDTSTNGGGGGATPILAGGVIGLLVGGGTGAALMASRRRNDGAQPGFGTGIAVAGGPPHPYGSGPSGHATVPATDAWGNPIMASATPPPGPAAADLARAKRLDRTPREWTVAVPGGTAVRLDDIGAARLMPRVTDHGRVWAMGRSDVAATAGWFEKREGKGEDAEPTLRIHAGGRGIIGVYDGTGGAGATVARTTGDGTELSGAWLASRLVRDVVEAWFVGAVADQNRALETADLAATLHQVLTDEAEHLPPSRNNVRGSLHRVLPTTAACIAFDSGSGSANGTVDALWAGDSRGYVLTPDKGLQVLTRDDTREDDALALIRNDQPMENLISADRPFRVNHRRYALTRPMLLLTATDGAFGYVRTPAHFEYLLLHSLAGAESMNSWSARLLAAFAEFAADDVSFSIAAIGFDSFADLKTQFTPRHDYLAVEHWSPFVDNTGDGEAIERLREDSWSVYKELYGAQLASAGAAVPADQRPAGQ